MPRGQTVEYTLKGNAGGLVSATAAGVSGFDKLGAAAQRSTDRAAKFADGIGKVSTTLARSADTFGIPAKALRAIDDAADVAELGLANLSKGGLAKFNVATFAAAGAAASLGFAIGTLARDYIPGLAKAADDAADALLRLFRAQSTLDREALGGMSQAEWLKRTGFSGKSMEKQLEDQAKAAKKVADEAKRAAEERFKYLDVAGRAVEAERKIRLELELQRKTLAYLGPAKELLWRAGMIAGQRMQDAGAPGLATSLGPQDILRLSQHDLSDSFKTGLLAPPLGLGGRQIDATGLRSNVGQDTERAIVSVTMRLTELRSALELLGVGANSTIGRLVGGLAVFSASLEQLRRMTTGQGGPGLLKSLTGGAGFGNFLGAASGVLGIAGAAVGIIKGIFGGGPSKEEREAERQRQEQERRRIQEAAQAMHTRGVEGLATAGPQFFMQRTISTPEEAARQGTLFAAAWGQVVKEKGIVAAAAAFKDAFAKMKADIEAAGIEAPAWLTAIGGEMELGLNDEFKAVAEAAHTAAEFLRAFAEAGGVLTPDTIRAFEQEARNAFNQGKTIAEGLGKDNTEATKAGFAAANPILQELLNQSIVSGQALSSDISELIKQAGIVPDVDVQSLDELRKIRAAVEGLAGMGGGGGGGNGGSGGKNPPAWVDEIPRYARGGRTEEGGRIGDGGHLAVLDPGETVVPDEDAEDFARSVLGNSGSVETAQNAILSELRRRDPAVTVQASVQMHTDTSMLPRHSQQEFLTAQEDRMVKSARPGGRLYTEIVSAAESVFRRRTR